MHAYLELDVRILGDIFQAFRYFRLLRDKLDPVHIISLPGLSFQSAFKMTGETIDLLQDPYLYNLFERELRGGVTAVITLLEVRCVIKEVRNGIKNLLLQHCILSRKSRLLCFLCSNRCSRLPV